MQDIKIDLDTLKNEKKEINDIISSEIDKIEDENSSSIEEIKKRDKINIYIHNNEKSNIDKILQKLNNDYKIIKQTDNFYGTVYTISK